MRRAITTRQRPGNNETRAHRTLCRRKWPHDTLAVGEWYDLRDKRRWQAARNQAYKFAKRHGWRFSIRRYEDELGPVMRVERVE